MSRCEIYEGQCVLLDPTKAGREHELIVAERLSELFTAGILADHEGAIQPGLVMQRANGEKVGLMLSAPYAVETGLQLFRMALGMLVFTSKGLELIEQELADVVKLCRSREEERCEREFLH